MLMFFFALVELLTVGSEQYLYVFAYVYMYLICWRICGCSCLAVRFSFRSEQAKHTLCVCLCDSYSCMPVGMCTVSVWVYKNVFTHAHVNV